MDVGPARQPRSPLVFQVGAEPHFPCLEQLPTENLLEKVIMANFPNRMREKVTQIQETQRVPSKRTPKRPTARHIIINMAKFQHTERLLKTAREKKEVTYNGAMISLATDF